MLRAAIEACVPELTDDPDEMIQQEWSGLCYTAAKRWVSPAKNADWVLVHGTVLSERVGKRVNHAWCEHDGRVVDLTLPVGMRIIEREEYYRITARSQQSVFVRGCHRDESQDRPRWTLGRIRAIEGVMPRYPAARINPSFS
jgi:hypothetical protein